MHIIQRAFDRGHLDHQRSIKGQSIYLDLTPMITSFIRYATSNCRTNYPWGLDINKGHQVVKSWSLEVIFRTAKNFTHIRQCYTSCLCFKTLSFEVIRGQWRSAWGQSFDLKLTWPYFLCDTAVLSFRLICNLPFFSVIVMLTIIDIWEVN